MASMQTGSASFKAMVRVSLLASLCGILMDIDLVGQEKARFEGLKVECRANKATFVQNEPVLIELTFFNESSDRKWMPFHISRFYVSLAGGDWKEYFAFETSSQRYGHYSTGEGFRILQPGESGKHRQWLLLLRRRDPAGDPKMTIEFPFEKEGCYKLNVRPTADGAAEFTVIRHHDLASDIFRNSVAAMFLGETAIQPADVTACENLIRNYARSVFAPYAALALWKYRRKTTRELWDATARAWGQKWLKETMPYLDFVIENAGKGALQEEALKWKCESILIVGSRAAQREKPAYARDFEKCFAILADAYPQSPYLADLQNSREGSGLCPRSVNITPLQPIPKKAGICKASLEGLEKLPEGPRQAFVAFWTGIAEENLAMAFRHVADDFEWDDGDRENMRNKLAEGLRNANLQTLQITIREAKPVPIYQAAAGRGKGKEKELEGELYLVQGTLQVTWVRLMTGREEQETYTKAEWVLRRTGSEWKLVFAQHEVPPPQSQEAQNKVYAHLLKRGGFKTWRLSDGTRERFPFEEVLPKLELGDSVEKDSVDCMLIGSDTLDNGWGSRLYVAVWRKADEGTRDGKARIVEVVIRLTDDESECLLEDVKTGAMATIPIR